MKRKNFLLTGPPGCGKTTVIIKLARLLGFQAKGFYTGEIRPSRVREGFKIVSLGGKEEVLAHVDFCSKYKVGKYKVLPERMGFALEEIKGALSSPQPCCLLIDEIGKMELLHPEFQQVVEAALDSALPVVATVMAQAHPWVDRIKNRADAEVIPVTPENRDRLPQELYHRVMASLGHHTAQF